MRPLSSASLSWIMYVYWYKPVWGDTKCRGYSLSSMGGDVGSLFVWLLCLLPLGAERLTS